MSEEKTPIQGTIQRKLQKNPIPIKLKFTGDPKHILSKEDEDAGYDIYTTETNVIISPGETHMFATGIYTSFPSGYWIEIKERGSTAKYGLSVRSGVVDSGYRGEWFIGLTNCGNQGVAINWVSPVPEGILEYPYGKAIAQAIIHELPPSVIIQVDELELDSKRGIGKCGSSGK